jgi:hypothetical protein
VRIGERDAKPLKVPIRQFRKNVDLDALFGKARSVAPHPDLPDIDAYSDASQERRGAEDGARQH